MFTGIIEEVGTVKAFDRNSSGARLVISAGQVLADLSVGGSISVNGVCLTAIDITGTSFAADLSPETHPQPSASRPAGRVDERS